ncbi:hypothetical protein Hanom_Chr10g00952591 [Helianthus anomalus]
MPTNCHHHLYKLLSFNHIFINKKKDNLFIGDSNQDLENKKRSEIKQLSCKQFDPLSNNKKLKLFTETFHRTVGVHYAKSNKSVGFARNLTDSGFPMIFATAFEASFRMSDAITGSTGTLVKRFNNSVEYWVFKK